METSIMLLLQGPRLILQNLLKPIVMRAISVMSYLLTKLTLSSETGVLRFTEVGQEDITSILAISL